MHISSNNTLGNKTISKTNNAKDKNNSSSRPSLFAHKIITKNDITVLTRGKGSSKLSYRNQTQDFNIEGMNVKGNCDTKALKPIKSVIIDSIPSSESNCSDLETMQSQDSDMLFLPYYDAFDRDDFFEEETYNDDMFYGKNDHFFPLKRFQEKQTSSISTSATVNITNSDSYTLGLSLQLFEEIKDEDFWKEVKGTNEDLIPINVDCYNNDNINTNKRTPVVSYNRGSSSIENFLLDEYSTTCGTSGSNYSSTMNTNLPQYNIKLLCYRDADVNFSLKTTNQLKNNCNITNFISNDPTGLVGGRRINKKRLLLQKAIRRKSGFREMISTGLEINEFML